MQESKREVTKKQKKKQKQNKRSKHTTSQQRRCNVVTLQQHCNDVLATLCVYWEPTKNNKLQKTSKHTNNLLMKCENNKVLLKYFQIFAVLHLLIFVQ